MLENFQLGLDIATALSVIGAALVFMLQRRGEVSTRREEERKDRINRRNDEMWTYFKQAIGEINGHKLEIIHEANKLYRTELSKIPTMEDLEKEYEKEIEQYERYGYPTDTDGRALTRSDIDTPEMRMRDYVTVTNDDYKMIISIQLLADKLLAFIRDDIKVDLENVLEYYEVKESEGNKIIGAIMNAQDKLSEYSRQLPTLVTGAIRTGVTKKELIHSIMDITVAHLSDQGKEELQSLVEKLNEFNQNLLKQIQKFRS